MGKHKFNVQNFGLALGFITAGGTFVLGLMAAYLDWGTELVKLISDGYLGYSADFAGSIIGAIWGFIDGFFGGMIFAWLYNKLQS